MKVLVYGAGRFGRSIAEEFARHPRAFTEVTVSDPDPATLRDMPKGIRAVTSLPSDAADILVLAASLVPPSARERLLEVYAPIEAFWRLERRYNLPLMRRLFPWIQAADWKLLVVASNPVDDWVNALQLLLGNRKIVGLGTAFDSQRIRFLAAALSPGSELQVLRQLKVIGGHGTAINAGNFMRQEVFEVAKWMSNTLSIAFLKAPDLYTRTWWTEVAIRPFVRGLMGIPTRTHLVVTVRYGGISAATGLDVLINHLTIRKRPLAKLSTETAHEFTGYLRRMREVGGSLARKISRQG